MMNWEGLLVGVNGEALGRLRRLQGCWEHWAKRLLGVN
jgi:hypothetical protein